ncbi:hypothetical protein HZY97_08120 [Sphingomonas sp. R-74633]|uniref:hypothetical protein n=1 Tax=Sphingomonas sp. R-74633 TaxID=2751188 RepID=UPI0015D1FC89|nr:hypothetical protein [Sphingomonas sp. R-74633]NYT40719.1 hypothetical protein [Sphingomonas sp. R-74633]
MARDAFSSAWEFGFDLWSLSVEANTVIALRTFKIANGGSAAMAEANLMVAEKIETAIEAQARLLTGGFGASPGGASRALVRHYGKKIRSNRRRLSR